MFKVRSFFGASIASLLVGAALLAPGIAQANAAKDAGVTINFLSYEEFAQLTPGNQEAYMEQMQEFIASLDAKGVDVASFFETFMASPKASWLAKLLEPAEAADDGCATIEYEVKNDQVCVKGGSCDPRVVRSKCSDKLGAFNSALKPEDKQRIEAAKAARRAARAGSGPNAEGTAGTGAAAPAPTGGTTGAPANTTRPPVRQIPTDQKAAEASREKPLTGASGGVAATPPVARRAQAAPTGGAGSIAPSGPGDLPAKTTSAPPVTASQAPAQHAPAAQTPSKPAEPQGAPTGSAGPAAPATSTPPAAPAGAAAPAAPSAPAAKQGAKPSAKPDAKKTADGGSFRCIYAGFTIYGKECVPRRSYTDPKTNKVYTCGKPEQVAKATQTPPLPPKRPSAANLATAGSSGGILCNPALFGTKADGSPICVDLSKRRSATKQCLDLAKKTDGSLKKAVEIAHHDPKMMARITSTLGSLCEGKTADAYIQKHLASLTEKSRKDLTATCKVYKERLDDFQRASGPNGKPAVVKKADAPAAPAAPAANGPTTGTPGQK